MMLNKNHQQIIKSTSIMGSSALVVLIFNLLKTKIAAVTIGKLGLGLVATFTVIQSLIVVLFSMGLPMSILRHLVAAFTENNAQLLALIVKTSRRLFLFLAMLGTVITMGSSNLLSKWSFDDLSYSHDILLMSLTIFFSILTAGELLILQGMRKVVEIGRMNIVSAFFTCLISSSFYCLWSIQGIIPSFIVCSLMTYLISRYFTSQYTCGHEKYSWKEGLQLSGEMLYQGILLLTASLIFNFTAYLMNLVLQKNIGLEGLGLYSAVVAISSVLINFILNAMSTDYYPRLISVSENENQMHQYINDQIEVGIAIIVPGLIALMIFVPVLIILFYSKDYLVILDTLRLFIFGYFFKIISWPLGFALLAKKFNKLYLLTEIVSQTVLILVTFYFVNNYGLIGTALGLIVMYILYFSMMLYVLHAAIDFQLNQRVFNLILKTFVYFLLSLLFLLLKMPIFIKYFLAGLVFLFSFIESYQRVKRMSLFHDLPLISKVKSLLGKSIWKLKIVKS